jgi:hypothetical protein
MITAAKVPFAAITIGGTEYRLKINTQSAIDAEKKLGTSLARAWVRLDEVSVQTTILWAAFQAYNAGITFEKAMELRDSFIEEAENGMDSLADVIKEVYICSGFMKRELPPETPETQEEKN